MATARPGLLFEQTFDIGSTVSALGFKHSGNTDTTLATIAGQRAAEIALDHYDSRVSYRTEIQPTKLPTAEFDNGMFAKMNHEYWYGMRLFLDEGWKQVDKADTVLMQFHSQPDPGEAWRSPPVALQVVNKNGEQHLNLIVRSDGSKITTGSGEGRYDSSKQYDLGKIDGDIGKWTDLVWHVKWNHDGSGYLQLYKNGEIIADLKGANAFNDATGPYLKMGLYKYDWANGKDTGPDSRTVYIDDFRVGGSDAEYATVAPGANGVAAAPAAPANAGGLMGTAGADKLVGGPEGEIIAGGAGNDDLIGNGGNDVLEGGSGVDILTGGGGHDRFVKAGSGEGIDFVTDFGPGDVLDLTALDQAVKTEFGHWLSAEHLHFVQSGAATLVTLDVDGKGGGVSETLFHLDGVTASSLSLGDDVLLHPHDGVA